MISGYCQNLFPSANFKKTFDCIEYLSIHEYFFIYDYIIMYKQNLHLQILPVGRNFSITNKSECKLNTQTVLRKQSLLFSVLYLNIEKGQ